jgi:hypothetical protein
VAINKWLQSSQEGNYANLYEQTYGRKILERKSEIRKISQYKEREQDYEGKDTRCYKEWCFIGDFNKFNMLV